VHTGKGASSEAPEAHTAAVAWVCPFSGREKELASRRFQQVFSDLSTECPYRCFFVNPLALMGFFHDAAADQKTKNAIVVSLISLCLRGIGQHYLAVVVNFLNKSNVSERMEVSGVKVRDFPDSQLLSGGMFKPPL